PRRGRESRASSPPRAADRARQDRRPRAQRAAIQVRMARLSVESADRSPKRLPSASLPDLLSRRDRPPLIVFGNGKVAPMLPIGADGKVHTCRREMRASWLLAAARTPIEEPDD